MTAGARAEIEITASAARLPAALRVAASMFKGFAQGVSVAASPLKAIGGMFANAAVHGIAFRGLDMMIDESKKVFDFQRELIRFGIDIRKTPEQMAPIGEQIRKISNETGVGADKVLDAARKYVDLAGAEAFTTEKMDLLARAAQASGAEVSDMAALLFTLTENMKVPPDQLEDTLGGLINQAKDGSIHFKELSKELIALGAVYSQFGTTGREGVIQLGAQMQIARHGFGSASEAGTGILRIYRSLPQHASKFAKAGVSIWREGSKTVMRPFEDIIKQIQKSPLALNREALIKSFGRSEGERFYQLLTAMTGQYDKLKEAGEANGVIQKDLATYTESTAGRLDVAWERMRNAFAAALTPERVEQIVGGIQSIANAMPSIMSAVGRVSDAFGRFVHMVRKAKDAIGGGSHLELSSSDQDIVDAVEGSHGTGMFKGRAITPDKIARYREITARKRSYDSAIEEIMGQENDFGATDESIKRAITAAKRGYSGGPDARHTPEELAAAQAASNYLAARKDEIPAARYKRLEGELDKEFSAAVVDHLAGAMKDAIREGFQSAMRPGALIPMEVRFDANSASRAIADSSSGRRR